MWNGKGGINRGNIKYKDACNNVWGFIQKRIIINMHSNGFYPRQMTNQRKNFPYFQSKRKNWKIDGNFLSIRI